MDAFFLGKALAEALNERIESSVGEFLSTIGRLQAEQQKQVEDFQVNKFKFLVFQFIYELLFSLICWFQSMSNIMDGPPLSLFPKFTCILVLFLSDFHTFIFALSFCYKVVVCMSLKLKLPP